MKSKDVLKLLGVTRVTLTSYVKSGKIKVTKLGNGFYDYDDTSVFAFLKSDPRINVIYSRVSTYKQKNDLARQIDSIIDYCNIHDITYGKIFKDISSGLDFDRKNFSLLMDDVFNYKIQNIYISYKDRLTRLSFKTIEHIFYRFGTSIIIINDDDEHDTKNTEKELFDELISLIHHFSTKIYSKRKKGNLDSLTKSISLFK